MRRSPSYRRQYIYLDTLAECQIRGDQRAPTRDIVGPFPRDKLTLPTALAYKFKYTHTFTNRMEPSTYEYLKSSRTQNFTSRNFDFETTVQKHFVKKYLDINFYIQCLHSSCGILILYMHAMSLGLCRIYCIQ